MNHITYPLTIYYDAACPMCNSEMEALKANDRNNLLILVDCSASDLNLPESCPITKEEMMTRIHAVDANGQWIKNTDVFAAAYAASGYQNIANFWTCKALQPVFKRVYPWVADNRQWLSRTPLLFLVRNGFKLLAR